MNLIISNSSKIDGSHLYETYTSSDGRIFNFVSDLTGTTVEAIIEARTTELNKKLGEEEVATGLVGDTMLSISKFDFLTSFTPQERSTIRSSNDAIVQDFIYLLELSDLAVNLRNPTLVAAMQYLVSINYLTQERYNIIMGV